ncbi:hypothetical protein TNCV_3888641 [Trichonephila clavipes]|nr:hypothetical protein TNCV_3888641 [Trichonephila clavipes]
MPRVRGNAYELVFDIEWDRSTPYRIYGASQPTQYSCYARWSRFLYFHQDIKSMASGRIYKINVYPKGIPKVRQSSNLKLTLSGTTINEGQELLCPSQYTWSLGAEVHDQMSRLGGLSEVRPQVFKTQSKLGTHLSTYCSGDKMQSRPCRPNPLIEPGTVVWKHDTLFDLNKT